MSLGISKFHSKGRVLLGDFNTCVGKGLDSDDVVGLYEEDVCNSNGSKLVKLMQLLDSVLWNCREFLLSLNGIEELCRD